MLVWFLSSYVSFNFSATAISCTWHLKQHPANQFSNSKASLLPVYHWLQQYVCSRRYGRKWYSCAYENKLKGGWQSIDISIAVVMYVKSWKHMSHLFPSGKFPACIFAATWAAAATVSTGSDFDLARPNKLFTTQQTQSPFTSKLWGADADADSAALSLPLPLPLPLGLSGSNQGSLKSSSSCVYRVQVVQVWHIQEIANTETKSRNEQDNLNMFKTVALKWHRRFSSPQSPQ